MAIPIVAAAAGYGLYKAGKAIFSRIGGVVTEATRKNVPILEDEVVVEVVGQPGASKQELYFLALATANGIVRRFQPLLVINPIVPPTQSILMIEYDASDNWVRCTLKYAVGTTTAAVVVPPELQNTTRSSAKYWDNLAIYRGPQCDVVGGAFDFIDPLLPGIPSTIDKVSSAPKLPWAGRTILTGCPKTTNPEPIPLITDNPVPSEAKVTTGTITSPNPHPPGDNRSRGRVVAIDPGASETPPPGSNEKCCPKRLDLVQLVFAALTDPGSFAEELWVGPTQGPTGS